MVKTYDEKVELMRLARLAKASKLLMMKKEDAEAIEDAETPIKKSRSKKANVIDVIPPEPEIEVEIEEPEPEPEPEPVVVSNKYRRSIKVKVPVRTLDLPPTNDIIDDEPIQEVIEIVKVKKPKQLIRKVIQQVYESDEEVEIIEEVIVKPQQQALKKEKMKKPSVFEINALPTGFNFNF